MVERRKDSKNRVLNTGESERKQGGYQYRWTTPDKKRHIIYAPNLKQLREKEAIIQRDLADGIRSDSENITVDDLFSNWIDLKKNNIKRNTLDLHNYTYSRYIKEEFGAYKVSSIRKSDVRRFYKELLDVRHFSLNTVKNIHSVLNQVFEFAKDDDIIRKNPCEKALKDYQKNHKTEKRKALTRNEQKLFIDFLKANKKFNYLYPIFMVMIGTGMRVGEVTGLQWEDIDFKKNIIHVNRSLSYMGYTPKEKTHFIINSPKSASGFRVIPMTKNVKEAFLLEKKYQKSKGIKCQSNIEGYSNFVFLTRSGNVRCFKDLNAALNRIIRRCNEEITSDKSQEDDPILLPHFSCHILRHTFATRLCESGINMKVAQEVLGHANIEMTLNVYTDASDDFKQKEFNKFDDFC